MSEPTRSLLPPQAALQFQEKLQRAVVDCSARGLNQAAKWAAELLNSFPPDQDDAMTDTAEPASDQQPEEEWDTDLERREHRRYLLAKSFFDCQEFDRCANVFVSTVAPKIPLMAVPGRKTAQERDRAETAGSAGLWTGTGPISRKALFLALYAKYLAGEKRKDEDSEMILGPADGAMTTNKELSGLTQALVRWFNENPGRDGGGWLEYLYGVVLSRSKNEEQAREMLLRSIRLNPFNWAAWEELVSLMGTPEELVETVPKIPTSVMKFIFYVYASQELFTVSATIMGHLGKLMATFPRSGFLLCQQALLYYHLKDFETSSSIFSHLLRQDPYRLDSLDVFSNVLYVLENRPLLTFLAHTATATNRFRPETCCIVGNYHSLLSDHEKATLYFRRALYLDRSFSAAWTLMGHEYVEMQNTHAAIESYRRAIEVSRRDYRAWYGLGQTYEFLEVQMCGLGQTYEFLKMQTYALFYYQRAASLRPFDPKMWAAVGTCYGRMGKLEDAVKAYKRALVAGSHRDSASAALGLATPKPDEPAGASSAGGGAGAGGGFSPGELDPDVLFQIGTLYERLGDGPEAAAYMELVLAQEDPDGGSSVAAAAVASTGATVGAAGSTGQARRWLAKWAFGKGDLGRAESLARMLVQEGVLVDDANGLLQEIQVRREQLAAKAEGRGDRLRAG